MMQKQIAQAGNSAGRVRPRRTRFNHVHDWEGLAHKAGYSPTALANLCHVSLRHLQRHFRLSFKIGVRDWLIQLRLTKARELLQGAQSVKEVAFELGYKQLSHFSRDFKSHHGISPSVLLQARTEVEQELPDPKASSGPQLNLLLPL
jgi:AraC-like DNA-binding protein